MHNPLAVVHDVREALELACLERIPPYLKNQRKQLMGWFKRPLGALNEPLVEFDPPFEPAEVSWRELVQEGWLCEEAYQMLELAGTLKGDGPYRHQFQAIRDSREGRSLVISAGTGSGKTECFLIPILDSLVREARESAGPLQGMRSLMIYPLNALVFDQMGRWRKVLRHQREVLGDVKIRISMYNSFLKRDQEVGADLKPIFKTLSIPDDDRDLYPYVALDEGEVLDRGEFLDRDGANLLITNYVMMELALLRDVDQGWLGQANKWRHLVLDEAHSYTGGLALDLAMLLRRMRDRIQPQQTVQGFATSATFGGCQAGKELSMFSGVLFDQAPEDIRVIQGRRGKLQADPAAPTCIQDKYKELIAILQAEQDPARLSPLVMKVADLASRLFADRQEPQVDLQELLRKCSEAPSSLPNRALLPHRLHAVLRRPVAWPSTCINPDCEGRDQATGFRRWEGLGWAGNSELDDLCPYCDGPMLPFVTCSHDGCALEGLMAREEPLGSWDVRLQHPGSMPPKNGDHLLLLIPAHGSSLDGLNGIQWIRVDHSGLIEEAAPGEAHWAVCRIKDNDGIRCPKCLKVNTLEVTWRDTFHAGAMNLVGLDRLTVLQRSAPGLSLEPLSGRRLMTFSDSRQGAARLAPRLAFTHRVLLVRRWAWTALKMAGDQSERRHLEEELAVLRGLPSNEVIQRMIEAKQEDLRAHNSGLGFEDLKRAMVADEPTLRRWALSLEAPRYANYLKDLEGDREDGYSAAKLETEWFGLIRGEIGQEALECLRSGRTSSRIEVESFRTYLDFQLELALLRELCRPSNRTPGALRLGFMAVAISPMQTTDKRLESMGIPENLHEEVLARAFQVLLEARCVRLPERQRPRGEDWSGTYLNQRARRAGASKKDDIFSFTSDSLELRFSTAWFVALAQALEIGVEQREAWLRDLFDHLWDMLVDGSNQQRLPLGVTNEDGENFLQILPLRMRFRVLEQAFRCRRCGQVGAYGGLGRCGSSRYLRATGRQRSEPCLGELERVDPCATVDPLDDAYPHARGMLLQPMPPDSWGLTAFEHTAQRKGDDVRRDELLFRRGQMNVLCSSTTLEMGIDLPDLDAIVLMGIPPAAANHTQRVGRAGRQRERACLALVLAGDDAFERWAHRDLMAFLRRPGIPPRVDLDRDLKLKQHFFAWRLGTIVREGRLRTLGYGPKILGSLEAFAGLTRERPEWARSWNDRHPGSPWRNSQRAPGWGDELCLLWRKLDLGSLAQATAMFERDNSTLEAWLNEGQDQIEQCLRNLQGQAADLQEESKVRSEKHRKRRELLLEALKGYDALTWLAERQILPRYGFPVSNTRLNAPKLLRKGGLSTGVDRSRRQAVLEWAPGAQVVVAGRVWEVDGLDSDFGRGLEKTHHRLNDHHVCLKCSHPYVTAAEAQHVCPVCGGVEADTTPIATPAAFSSLNKLTLAGTTSSDPAPSGRRVLALDDKSWGEDTFAFRPSVEVAFLNTGTKGEGFLICDGCGKLALASDPWRHTCALNQGEDPNPVFLGEVVRMDVLRILCPEGSILDGARTLAQALRLAAAYELELDPRNLTVADLDGEGRFAIHLIDLADGGSGLLARLTREPDRQAHWLGRAKDLLSHSSSEDQRCVNACPACILTHDNRIEHNKRPFRRQEGLRVLEVLMAAQHHANHTK